VLEIGAYPRDETSPEGEERVALHPLLAELTAEGVLEQLDVTTAQEQRELVRFAAELDDGEAHTCALALVRRARIATDDRKAVRVFTAASKGRGKTEKPVLRTSELLFSWAEQHKIPDLELVHVVTAVVSRASFAPPRDDPHFERWMALLGRAR